MRTGTRVILCFAATFAIGFLVDLPDAILRWRTQRTVNAWRLRVTNEIKPGTSFSQVHAWLQASGLPLFTETAPSDQKPGHILSLMQVDPGGIMHRPEAIRIDLYFSAASTGADSTLVEADVSAWAFLVPPNAGRYPIEWPKLFSFLPIAYLLFLGVRQSHRTYRSEMRRLRGECPACGYPIGQSDRCSECGHDLAEIQRRRRADASAG